MSEQAQAVAEELAVPHTNENAQENFTPPPDQESDEERNFRALRNAKAAAEARAEEAAARMEAQKREIEELRHAVSSIQPKEPEEPQWSVDEDGWVTGRDLEKYTQTRVAKEVEKRLQDYQKQRELQEAPARLRSRFSDFDQVVTQEAIERLQRDSPALFATVQASTAGPMELGEAVYTMLKRTQDPAVEAGKAKLEQNKATPQSLAAARPGSPVAELGANNGIMTEERKAQVRKMMAQQLGEY